MLYVIIFYNLQGLNKVLFTLLWVKWIYFQCSVKNFRYVFPMLLLVLIALNTFDVYSLVLSKLGLRQFVFSEDFTDDKIEEGRKMIALARTNYSILNCNSTDLKLFKAY